MAGIAYLNFTCGGKVKSLIYGYPERLSRRFKPKSTSI
jgi:hypothetical protein